ncbi:glycolate oxidase iron-sulfur subunit [Sphingomonas koreensis]|uniref:glycolate oxidase subunit GlcF n=1 Tax=Sphingomonas koreensis TaxID=93064 RepID=UPI00082F7460|nr:glycolate oxidase subunit GlcF [Sphingomonas koreensis]PJI89322.1 glycolate oxidase iron-sulfur subunit [Sphingomonas koreensis]RSU59250.1 glycolate oxidase iron-sulfur subunit [Sphingomonas koreensis]RSU68290.1 glycolate oxidase iron-sulfur subunit [Sphingomonas koreensis]
MQTRFTPEQLADPAMASSEGVIRKCVHCGFCTATCPTYALLGDELDSPRGRIYLIKDMLENQRKPGPETVKHIDRCLSCLSCMTTCPSGVNYMHLVDHARAYIHENYGRPWHERAVRRLLAWVLPYPGRFRAALLLARLGRPFAPLVAGVKPLAAMLAMAPKQVPAPVAAENASVPGAKGRIALLQGCAEPVLKPEYRAAAIRLLNRAGYDVVFAAGEGCCGALVHHMGREADGLDAARRNVDAWMREIDGGGLAAIVVTASGCGTTIKDYGFMLRNDPAYAGKAALVSGLAKDISELLAQIDLPPGNGRGLTVAYHPACSLQHGQKVTDAPKRLLAAAGYAVRTPAEAHLCCGSAGTYNILQPEIADQLGDRKASHLDRLQADVIATGNVGCAMQIARFGDTPVVHTIELLDWATGGPAPAVLTHRDA